MVCTNMHHAEPGEGESQPLGNDVVGQKHMEGYEFR